MRLATARAPASDMNLASTALLSLAMSTDAFSFGSGFGGCGGRILSGKAKREPGEGKECECECECE